MSSDVNSDFLSEEEVWRLIEEEEEVYYNTDSLAEAEDEQHFTLHKQDTSEEKMNFSITPADLERFKIIGEQVYMLRSKGQTIHQIMNRMKFKQPSTLRRLESVLEWLEEAGLDPRAAILAKLDKSLFLNVVSRQIMTVDELAEQMPHLSRNSAFSAADMVQIQSLVQNSQNELAVYQ